MDDAKLEAASAIALAVTLFLIFTVRPLARRFGLVDKPNERKRHRGSVPLIGGLCFFLGTVVGLAYAGYVDRTIATLMIPSGLIVMVGVLDDLFDLSVRLRLAVQAAAAVMVIAASGLYLDHAGRLFGDAPFALGALGIPLSVIAVIGLINAFNMLDGIDGLAASIAMVAIAAIFLYSGGSAGAMTGVLLLLQVLFAALVPYLCVNLGWPDGRKVFMGDAGSTLIGFLLAWSLIFMSHSSVDRIAPVDALWVVAVPVMDTFGVMYRRARRGVSVFKPDRQHLHHLLQDAGLTPRMALAVIVAVAVTLVAVGYVLRGVPDLLNLTLFLAVLASYVLLFQTALERARLLMRGRHGLQAGEPTLAAASGNEPAPPAREPSTPPLRALCVAGSSPETLQLAPIVREMEQDGRFDARFCVAAPDPGEQERVLGLFGIRPDARIELPPFAANGAIDAETMNGMKRLLGEFRPDVVLVPGDSPATLAASLAAFSQRIPIARIESALPDEAREARADAVSRRLSSLLATVNIAPSECRGRRLLDTGIPAERIVLAPNAASASLRAAVRRIDADPELRAALAQTFSHLREGHPLLLVSCCGRLIETFTPLYRSLARIAAERPDLDIVCALDDPDHLRADALRRDFSNVHLIAPRDYLAFACLLERASVILAASTEVAQDVAPLGKPVLLLQRDDAGVAVDAANVMPVRAERDGIAESVLTLISDPVAYERMCLPEPAGEDACKRVVEALASLRPTADPTPAGSWAGLPVAPIVQGVSGSS